MTEQTYPGEQYTPSNGTEGYSFLEHWCRNCARDKAVRDGEDVDECDDNELCPIIGASFRGEAIEWRELDNGETKCMKFVPAGQPIPPGPDTHTVDMFEVPA